eukprot:s7081_g1.t1
MAHLVAQKFKVFFGKAFEDFGSTCDGFQKFLVFVFTKWLLEGLDPARYGLLSVSSQVLMKQHTIAEVLRVNSTFNNVCLHDKGQLLKQAATLGRLRTVGTLDVAGFLSFKLSSQRLNLLLVVVEVVEVVVELNVYMVSSVVVVEVVEVVVELNVYMVSSVVVEAVEKVKQVEVEVVVQVRWKE